MVLRDLPDRGIGGRDNVNDPAKGGVGNLRPAKRPRDTDRPQPALRERIEFADRPDAVTVANRGVLFKRFRETFRYRDRLVIVADDVGGLLRARDRSALS